MKHTRPTTTLMTLLTGPAFRCPSTRSSRSLSVSCVSSTSSTYCSLWQGIRSSDEMRIHVHLYHHQDDILDFLRGMEKRIMASLDETLAAVTAEKTADDSIVALLAGIKAQLAAALANATLSPADQAKVDAIFAAATANASEITAAIAAP